MVSCCMHSGFERPEAKLTFVWSQLLVTDELKRRKRATSLTFFDLVEVGDSLRSLEHLNRQ